ncbi:MAG: DMT family transporter [Pseudomonadota bacterium]
MARKAIPLASIALVLIYAIQFISARYSLESNITPFGLTILRFVVCGIFFVPFLYFTGSTQKLRDVGLLKAFVLSFLAGFPYLMVINTGISLTSAGYVATVGPGSIVLFSFLLPFLFLQERPDLAALLSTLLICAGIGLFVYNTLLVTELSSTGTALFVLQGLMFSLFGVLTRRWNIDPLTATAAVSLVSCIPAILLFWVAETGYAKASASELGFQAVSQGLLAGIAAVAIFTFIVREIGPQRASLVMPSVPIITTIGGFFLLDETLTVIQLLGLGLLALGMATPGIMSLSNLSRKTNDLSPETKTHQPMERVK